MVFILFYIFFSFALLPFQKDVIETQGRQQKSERKNSMRYLFIYLSCYHIDIILLFLCYFADDDDKNGNDDYFSFALFSPAVENSLLSLFLTLRYIRLLSFQGEEIFLIHSILVSSVDRQLND